MEVRASRADYKSVLQAAVKGNASFFLEVEDNLLQSARCDSGCSVLHWAAGSNQLSIIEYLVRTKGLDVDIKATKKAKGRTPLHYSARNGCLGAAKLLLELGAKVDVRAKHGVTPFQLAVWQNHLDICQWLVEEQGVDPTQVNDFDCGAVHWLGISPFPRANNTSELVGDSECDESGKGLLPLARWLAKQPGCNFGATQRQGHTALHKASWGGHVALIAYLKEEHGLYDDTQDYAGNFAADLADMASSSRHAKVAKFLREHCSLARADSCAVLGVCTDASETEIRKAYFERVRKCHPDRAELGETNSDDFEKVKVAYQHLLHEKGHGNQNNPAHSLNLMLKVCGTRPSLDEHKDDDCFKARLIAVLLEYGDKGLDISNLAKKWKQVWPTTPFPDYEASAGRKIPLSKWIKKEAGDVVDLVTDDNGSIRLLAKEHTQMSVAEAALQAKKETCG